MADKINFNTSNQRYSFATKQELAWHSLGQVVDAMNSKEAIVLGGLDFHVDKRPLYVPGHNITTKEDMLNEEVVLRNKDISKFAGTNTDMFGNDVNSYRKAALVPGTYATIRTDTDQVLGVVGNKYHVLQNAEAFEFIDSIIGEGAADFETVGALGNGEVVFITCKLKAEMVVKKDLIEQYLVITTSHDGSCSTTVMFTPIRVVCNNTLTAALKGTKNKVSIRHTKNAKDKLEQAKQILGLIDSQTRTYQEAFEYLSTKAIDDTKTAEIIVEAFGLKKDESGRLTMPAMGTRDTVLNYYNTGVGQENILGSAWGVYNGITGYLGNSKEYKNADSKFKSILTGDADTIRNSAMKMLLTY